MSNSRKNSDHKPMKRDSRSSSIASSTSGTSLAASVPSHTSVSSGKDKAGPRLSLPKKVSSAASSIVSDPALRLNNPPPFSRINSGKTIPQASEQGFHGSGASIKSTQRRSGSDLFYQMLTTLATRYGCGGRYRILPDPTPVFNKQGGIDVTYMTGVGEGRCKAVTEWEVRLLRKFGLPKLSKPDRMPGAKLNKQLAELITTKFIVFTCDNGETCIIPDPETL
jgi:hypothetical protein